MPRPTGISVPADMEIERKLVLLIVTLEAERQDAKPLQKEAPDDAESIRFTEQIHVAAAEDNCRHLQDGDEIDDPVGGAEAVMRLAEPVEKYTVFRHPVQHTVRADE